MRSNWDSHLSLMECNLAHGGSIVFGNLFGSIYCNWTHTSSTPHPLFHRVCKQLILCIYIYTQKDMFKYIHSNIIHNNTTSETIQVSINARMDKWTEVCSQNEILHDRQYRWRTAVWDYIDEAYKYNRRWNESDTTVYVNSKRGQSNLWWPSENSGSFWKVNAWKEMLRGHGCWRCT